MWRMIFLLLYHLSVGVSSTHLGLALELGGLLGGIIHRHPDLLTCFPYACFYVRTLNSISLTQQKPAKIIDPQGKKQHACSYSKDVVSKRNVLVLKLAAKATMRIYT